jgi:hypothetical protein
MLTGPAAKRASEILAQRLPTTEAASIIDSVLRDPGESNLNFVGMLFPFTPEELNEIRFLRDIKQPLECSQKEHCAKVLHEIDALWQKLYHAATYQDALMSELLSSCVTLVEFDHNVDWNSAVRALLGYAYRLARVQHGVTQKQVCDQYGFSPQLMTDLEHGRREAHSHLCIPQYLRTLFPANSPREVQAFQLLMEQTDRWQDCFEHVRRGRISVA